MIVRCSNCNSAFAVDDTKVTNKRFAFTCPKCANENIIDNRKGIFEVKTPVPGAAARKESFTSAPVDDMAIPPRQDTAINMKAKSTGSDLKFDEELSMDFDTAGSGGSDMDGLPEFEDDLSLDMPSDESIAETGESPIDDMDLDIPDNLEDLDFDAGPGTSAKKETAAVDEMDDLDLGDLDDLGLEMEDIPAAKAPAKAKPSSDDLEDLDLDIALGDEAIELADEAGIDIEETLKNAEDIAPEESLEDLAPVEDDILFDASPEEITLDDEIVTEEVYSKKEEDEDESITIDLDTLDIELEEGEEEFVQGDETPMDDMDLEATEIDFEDSLIIDEEPAKPAKKRLHEDEDITLDLDSLDIDIQEEETISRGQIPDEDIDIDLPELSPDMGDEPSLSSQDEDITLDLDSLDIPLAETEEVKMGEIPDEDEKLTLADAGLTMDELTAEELASATSDIGEELEVEDDIRLTIDEIDPDLNIHELESEFHEAETILSVEDDELPEIDFDDYDSLQVRKAERRPARVSDEIMELDETYEDFDDDLSKKRFRDVVQDGAVNFSIDYSLKYSRLGAFLRLVQIFSLGLIPHFIVLFIYGILSMILGFINHIVVLSTKKSVEDFSEIIEKTLRYFLSISTSYIGIIEEMPIFSGTKDIDYAMQMNIVYPVGYSRILAALRLSIIGIIIATLPHLLILSIIGVTVPIFYLIGIISVLITARWPHFLFDILSRYYRYMARVMAFMTGLVDKYPPFTF